jgi:hypothetical protein
MQPSPCPPVESHNRSTETTLRGLCSSQTHHEELRTLARPTKKSCTSGVFSATYWFARCQEMAAAHVASNEVVGCVHKDPSEKC